MFLEEDEYPDIDIDTGHCDICNEPHQNSSILDHCAECGNCFDHCECKDNGSIDYEGLSY